MSVRGRLRRDLCDFAGAEADFRAVLEAKPSHAAAEQQLDRASRGLQALEAARIARYTPFRVVRCVLSHPVPCLVAAVLKHMRLDVISSHDRSWAQPRATCRHWKPPAWPGGHLERQQSRCVPPEAVSWHPALCTHAHRALITDMMENAHMKLGVQPSNARKWTGHCVARKLWRLCSQPCLF